MKEHNEWLGYRLSRPLVKEGKTYLGQRQKWFLLEYTGALPDADQARDREFSRFDWVDREWLLERTAPFKLKLYQTVFNDLLNNSF